jgi:acetyltransferase-like isoleucine patch superfamily enzyme
MTNARRTSTDRAPRYAVRHIVEAFASLRRAVLVFYYRLLLAEVGKNFRVGLGSVILQPERVRIGDNFFAGPLTYLSTPSAIRIGHNVMFGPGVMILGGDHDLLSVGKPMRFAPSPPPAPDVIIEDDVWIGARAIILKGVRIGAGSVIGAGSIVTRDVPSYVVAAGNPCRVLRPRFTPEQLARHLLATDSGSSTRA